MGGRKKGYYFYSKKKLTIFEFHSRKLILATVLDPRIKMYVFETIKFTVREWLEQELREIARMKSQFIERSPSLSSLLSGGRHQNPSSNENEILFSSIFSVNNISKIFSAQFIFLLC
jgi:hypothetical protein